MTSQDGLEWTEWCCLTCRRLRRTVGFWAVDYACEHGRLCAWGLDKYDGSCCPIGVPSESLYGLSDPPLVTDRKRWPAPKAPAPWPEVLTA